MMVNVAITGAGRGIGLELVRQYLDAGDRIYALCRSPDGADELNALAASSGGKLTVHKMDVGNDVSVKQAVESTGDGPIDIVLNVAGVVGGEKQGLQDQAWVDWHDAFNVMIIGPLRVMQAFLPRLGDGAKVINITSQLAASTWPYGGYYAYGAAKAGLNRMMRSVALDVRDRGIIIGLVHPGWVQTDMGGSSAEITTAESALGIRTVTAEWPLEQSGDFKKWNGETHPW